VPSRGTGSRDETGAAFPSINFAVDGNPAAIREFALTAEEVSCQELSAPNHVLGGNVASRPDWDYHNT
jgi:hypothetical protein